jgi:uncharacterized protein
MIVRRYGELLLKFRIVFALAAIALLGYAGVTARRIQFDLSIIPILRASKEARNNIADFRKKLPPVFIDLLVIVEWPEPITLKELDQTLIWDKQICKLSKVKKVHTLATVKVFEGNGGFPTPVSFTKMAKATSIGKQLEKHPLAKGLLISDHRKALAIMLERKDCSHEVLLKYCMEKIPGIIKDPKVKIRYIGAPLIQEAMTNSMSASMKQVLVLEAIFFIILLPLMFRTSRGLLLPLGVIGSAVVLNFGVMVWLGLAINIIGICIPGLIAVIALCDTIHMLHHFEEALFEGHSRDEAILLMLERVGIACFYTSFTTGIGFLSLSLAPHDAVVDFSITASLSVLVAFFCVVFLTPVALSLWPIRRSASRLFSQAIKLNYGKKLWVVIIFFLLVAMAIFGTRRVVVNSHWLEELPKSEPAVRNFLWFEDHFNGFIGLETELQGPLADIKCFNAVETLQKTVLKSRGVKSAESYTHWVREALGVSPESPMSQKMLLKGLTILNYSGPRFPRHVITRDRMSGRITLRIRELGTQHFMTLVREIEEESGKVFPAHIKVRVGGNVRIAHESASLVIKTMMQSMGLSLIAITLFIMLIFRSVKLGLLSIIPNALPVFVALGLNGLLNIELRIGIVMIYALGIGLAVDDTIHFLTRFIQEQKLHPNSVKQALVNTLRGTGKALITTSILLTVAALCYLPSSFKTMRDVGILLTPIVIVALAADLWLLPILLEWSYPDKKSPAQSEPPKA